MFKFFRKKTAVEKLEIKHKKLLENAFMLSHTNRKNSDLAYAEAEEVMKQIELLKRNN